MRLVLAGEADAAGAPSGGGGDSGGDGGGGARSLLLVLAVRLAAADRVLQELMEWMVGSQPAGFKLNDKLNEARGCSPTCEPSAWVREAAALCARGCSPTCERL